MAEQLRMPWEGEPTETRRGTRRPRRDPRVGDEEVARHPAAQTGRHRPRPPANRPVRGEPDLPEIPALPGEWRIDQGTRLAGLRGIARARAALVATEPGADAPAPGQVDAA